MILLNFLRNMSYFKSSPVDSILDAVLTVSPNRQYLGIFRPTTPEQTGPLNNEKNYLDMSNFEYLFRIFQLRLPEENNK